MMKQIFIFIIGIFSAHFTFSQELNPVNVGYINVNYYNTTHIIFLSDVEYYNTVDRFVSADLPETSVKNILRIKANEIDFKENTTLSVALVDGSFFSWKLVYSNKLENSVYYADKEQKKDLETVFVDENSYIHFIAPNRIKYVDIGDPDNISAGLADGTENIVKLIASKPDFPNSNISFASEKGQFFSYNLKYGQPVNYSYKIGTSDKVFIAGTQLSGTLKDSVDVRIKNIKKRIYAIGTRSNKITFLLDNILVYKDYLIFKVSIENRSNIEYVLENVQYFISDRKTNKKAINQEKELFPLFFDKQLKGATVQGKEKYYFYTVLNKFTIGKDKILCLRIMEAGNERNVEIQIYNNNIINAQKVD